MVPLFDAMRGLGDLNLRERYATMAPGWAIEWLCALACALLAAAVRLVIELLAPQAPPYILMFPLVLLATLLAGWRSGLITLALVVLGIWVLVLYPPVFGPLDAGDGLAMLLNVLSALAVIGVAQSFRTAYSAVGAERASKLEVRDLLLRELNHRVKNNFQMVEGLLDMQRRRSTEAATQQALGDALRRVHSMAQAHAFLYAPGEPGETIDLGAYLEDLCASLSDSLLLSGQVRLDSSLSSCPVHRDRAVAVGVVVNELVTNAAKHAFPDGQAGRILVALNMVEGGCELVVADDGVGLPPEGEIKTTGLGRKLIERFAHQAGGVLTRKDDPGASYVLVLPH